MPDRYHVLLDDRGILAVSGEEAVTFLQGLVSNDVARVAPDRAVYAALLTPQGKFLHDFFIARSGDALLIDCEGKRRDDLYQRLRRYRLRSKVTLQDVTDVWTVGLLVGDGAAAAAGLEGTVGAAGPFGGGVAFVDPRLPELGVRALLPRAGAAAALAATGLPAGDRADRDRRRMALGVPEGSDELPVDKAFLLENGFDELHGVDWNKGCYVGQELTARTKYRGLVRRRLLPVEFEGTAPDPGTAVRRDGKEVGEIRAVRRDRGLAMLRLEAVAETAGADGELTAGTARVKPHKPYWVRC